VTTDN